MKVLGGVVALMVIDIIKGLVLIKKVENSAWSNIAVMLAQAPEKLCLLLVFSANNFAAGERFTQT